MPGPMTQSPLLEFLTRLATQSRLDTVPSMRPATTGERLKDAVMERLQSLGEQPVAQVAGAVMGNPVMQKIGEAQDWGFRGNTRDDPNWKSAATVFHGSPHTFDKFDMSKVGTGEGAQAYGHGLYFADNPRVARSYREQLANPEVHIAGNQQSVPTWSADLSPQPWTIRALADARSIKPNASESEIVEHVRQRILPDLKSADNATVNAAQNKLDILQAASERQLKTVWPGGTYHVDLPDEAIGKMLDWDAPLSQQPESVKQVLAETGVFNSRKSLEKFRYRTARAEPTGADIHKALVDWFGHENTLTRPIASNEAEIARMLSERGIPGIKYFDGSSRAAGQGTRNYVVFDDKLPTILKVEK